MISPDTSLIGRVGNGAVLPMLMLWFAAPMAVGCVDLRKPPEVEACAAAGNCSDDPSQHVKRDAKEDAEEPDEDTASPDKPPIPDAAAEKPSPDVNADVGDRERDTRDVTGTDGKETGDVPVPDKPPADAGPDVGPDLRPDAPPDVGADTKPDLKNDLPPDLGRDQGVDLPPDLPPDSPPDANPLLTGLLAYYKCESATGTTLPDASGNGNNGTLGGSTSFATGKVGKALALARSGSGFVTLPPELFADATDITIAAWINVTTSQSWQRVFDVGFNAKAQTNSPTGTRYMNLVPKDSGTNLAFAISRNGYDNEQVLTTTAPATAIWKHVAVVLGSAGSGLYVDGNQAAPGSAVTLRPKDLGTIDYAYLGRSQFSADPYFDGMLDEVRVYGRALSAADVKALAQFTGP